MLSQTGQGGNPYWWESAIKWQSFWLPKVKSSLEINFFIVDLTFQHFNVLAQDAFKSWFLEKKLCLSLYQIKATKMRTSPGKAFSKKTWPSFLLTEKLTAHLRCYLGSDFGYLRDESYIVHTIYPGNNMCQKCGRKSGLWVLHESINKTNAENMKKIVGAIWELPAK